MQDQIRKPPTSPSRASVAGHLRTALVTAALALATITACAGLPMPGAFGGKSSSQSSSHTSTTTEESHTINGRPVDRDGNYEDLDDDGDGGRPRVSRRESNGADFGATCSRNTDCASNTCFTGRGDLGYCTRMCDSFTDCPKFWDCEKVGNAPQKICQQDAD